MSTLAVVHRASRQSLWCRMPEVEVETLYTEELSHAA
jgi:hypothetical protein